MWDEDSQIYADFEIDSPTPKAKNIKYVEPPAATLQSIAITTPADKLTYNVGDALDITGLVITGTYSDGATALAYERESFNVASNNLTANFWVKVPEISNTSDTTIYIYYGNPLAADGQDAADVWDSHFKGVWHLGETETNAQLFDSTVNHNNSIAQSWTPTLSGKIGGAASFNGSTSYIATPITVLGNPSMTISLWANLYSGAQSYSQIAATNAASTQGLYLYASGSGSNINFYLYKQPSYVYAHNNNAYSMGKDSLHYVTATFDGTNPKIYIDSIDRTGTNPVPGPANMASGSLIFGNNYGGNGFWKGVMDEVRLSDKAREPEWIKFEYYNINSANNEISIGAQESGPF